MSYKLKLLGCFDNKIYVTIQNELGQEEVLQISEKELYKFVSSKGERRMEIRGRL